MAHKVDINKYRNPQSIVLSGRPNGENTRKQEGLDNVDAEQKNVIISVPEGLKVITSSFLLGLLGDSIRKYGREEFLNKYNFEGKDIRSKIENCIEVAIKSNSPF